jgi:hypothetical protein
MTHLKRYRPVQGGHRFVQVLRIFLKTSQADDFNRECTILFLREVTLTGDDIIHLG